MRNLLIIGAGGHGKVIADIALKMNRWQEIAFLDDDEHLKTLMGFKVIGKSSKTVSLVKQYDIFIAIGNNATRERIYKQIKAAGAAIPMLIHPNASIGMQVEIGEGTVVMAGVVINSNSKIGKGCIVNTAATVDHDSNIGDYVHISPGAHIAGAVIIGKGSWIGIGASVSNNVKITEKTVIGAGAVVIKNISQAGVYVGLPARRLNDGKNSDISK